MLVLEIELLTGAYRAALPDGSGAEWPPHPERVYSALVQAYHDGGECPEEQAALEWLEAQEPPEIEASSLVSKRDAPTVYVPPNDLSVDKSKDGDKVLPERRPRQARTFRAAVPDDPQVRLRWRVQPERAIGEALAQLAARVASLGHSSSLVRMSFGDVEAGNEARTWVPDEAGTTPLRVPHAGRLAALRRWSASGERPRPGRTVWFRAPGEAAFRSAPASVFGEPWDWFVFEGVGGAGPDVLAFAHVAARVRAALMRLGPQPPPDLISGHDAGGGPAKKPHLAVVPLCDVGWDHARGDLLGFAVVLPRDLHGPARAAACAALAAFARLDREYAPAEAGRAELRLTRRHTWYLERVAAPSRASLRVERFCRTARTWASVTPVLLDRYADNNDPVEEAATLAAACRNIGLPEPEEIEIHKYAAVRGAPAAYPARGVAHRPDWTFPLDSKLRVRPRRHVVLRFAEPVRGPVLLGAGRFQGFGLCLALSDREGA